MFFKLEYDLPIVPMVLGGALCAASGRLVIAHASRRFRHRLSPTRREHLNAAAEALTGNRRRSAGALGLFALSPVPSAQLFVAAGLLDLRLVRLTAAFFAGRLISYTTYVSGAALAQESLGDVVGDAFASPIGIALQIAMLVVLIALLRINWAGRLARRRPDRRHAGETHCTTRNRSCSDPLRSPTSVRSQTPRQHDTSASPRGR